MSWWDSSETMYLGAAADEQFVKPKVHRKWQQTSILLQPLYIRSCGSSSAKLWLDQDVTAIGNPGIAFKHNQRSDDPNNIISARILESSSEILSLYCQCSSIPSQYLR
jgi:hypothetical protein